MVSVTITASVVIMAFVASVCDRGVRGDRDVLVDICIRGDHGVLVDICVCGDHGVLVDICVRGDHGVLVDLRPWGSWRPCFT